MASLPPSGPYQVRQPNDNLLTLLENFVGGPVNILKPTGNPGEQEWHLQDEGDSITLKNLRHNLFVGIEEQPQTGVPIVGVSQPFKWKLKEEEESKYSIYVDSSDGPLYLEYSPLRIFPPRAALSPRPGEPWILQLLE